jgi:hypothetical protein
VARCQLAMSHGGLLSGPAHSRCSRRSCAGFTTAAAKTQAAVSAPYGTARVKDGCLGRPSDDDDRRGFVGLAELRLWCPRKEFVTITYAAPISLGERGAEEIACAPTDKRSPLCTKFSAENDLQRQLAAFGSLYGFAAAAVIHKLRDEQATCPSGVARWQPADHRRIRTRKGR